MILTAIKFFSLFLAAEYSISKLLCRNTYILTSFFTSLILAVITSFLYTFLPISFSIFSCILFCLTTYHTVHNIKLSLIASLFSYSISYLAYSLSRFLFTIILYFFRDYMHGYPISLLVFLSSLSTPFLIIFLYSIKRFKSGMPFLLALDSFNIGILISLFIIFACIYTHYISDDYFSFSIQLLACLLLIPFIAWWRSQLTKSYRQYLKDMETRELRAKVEQLSADNQRLSQIVHKDNKLITAMTSSVLGMVEQAPNYSPEHLSTYSSSLYLELLSLSSHRQNSLSQLSGTITGQFHTGYMMLDSVLNLQAKQASELGVNLSVEHNAEFFDTIFSSIDEEQLAHITADLVQNAIIATKKSQNKSVEISFLSSANTPSIQVSDSGVKFPAVVLDNFGKERCSQHLDEGGSGIGLMDIWALKNTAKATLLIEEFPDGAPFRKRIHLIFDNKNRYLIMSDRKDELSVHLHRPDVLLLTPNH